MSPECPGSELDSSEGFCSRRPADHPGWQGGQPRDCERGGRGGREAQTHSQGNWKISKTARGEESVSRCLKARARGQCLGWPQVSGDAIPQQRQDLDGEQVQRQENHKFYLVKLGLGCLGGIISHRSLVVRREVWLKIYVNLAQRQCLHL